MAGHIIQRKIEDGSDLPTKPKKSRNTKVVAEYAVTSAVKPDLCLRLGSQLLHEYIHLSSHPPSKAGRGLIIQPSTSFMVPHQLELVIKWEATQHRRNPPGLVLLGTYIQQNTK